MERGRCAVGPVVRGVSLGARAWCGGWLGGVVVAVAVAGSGEESFDDAFESGYALGQRLQVLTHVGQAASDFGQAGIDFGAQTLVVRADFHSKRLRIGAGIASEGQQEPNHCGSDGEDSDEFGGHGRLHWGGSNG